MNNPWQIFVNQKSIIFTSLFNIWVLSSELPHLQVNVQIKACFYSVCTFGLAGNSYSREAAAKERDPSSQETFLQPPKTAFETHTYGMDLYIGPVNTFQLFDLNLMLFKSRKYYPQTFWLKQRNSYLFMGQIMKRQSLNFLGMFVKSPASGHTTQRSSTKLYTSLSKLHLMQSRSIEAPILTPIQLQS